MQVSHENLSKTRSKITVTIPEPEVSDMIREKIATYKKDANLPGFRRGHIPEKVIKQKFLANLMELVIEKSLFKAIEEQKLQILSQPKVDLLSKEGLDTIVSYTAEFDVLPEVKDLKVPSSKLTRYTAKDLDGKVEQELEALRRQDGKLEDSDVVKEHDKVNINFDGTIDKKPLENGKAENFDINIGSKSMIPGFEEGLVGKKLGDEFDLNLQFPEKYHAEDIAGKKVKFAIKINKIQTPSMVEINEEFCKKHGATDGKIETLKANLLKKLQDNVDKANENNFKNVLYEDFIKNNPVELPESLIFQEKKNIIAQEKANYKAYYGKEIDISGMLDDKLITEQAKKRVHLQILFTEFAKVNDIKIDKDKVEDKLKQIAKPFPEPEKIIAFYKSDKKYLSEIENVVLEDEVVKKLQDHATIKERKENYDKIMQEKQSNK